MSILLLFGGGGLLIVFFLIVGITVGLAITTWWPGLLIGGAVVWGLLWASRRFCQLVAADANSEVMVTLIPVSEEAPTAAVDSLDEPDWLNEDGDKRL